MNYFTNYPRGLGNRPFRPTPWTSQHLPVHRYGVMAVSKSSPFSPPAQSPPLFTFAPTISFRPQNFALSHHFRSHLSCSFHLLLLLPVAVPLYTVPFQSNSFSSCSSCESSFFCYASRVQSLAERTSFAPPKEPDDLQPKVEIVNQASSCNPLVLNPPLQAPSIDSPLFPSREALFEESKPCRETHLASYIGKIPKASSSKDPGAHNRVFGGAKLPLEAAALQRSS
jgi:hypothetical protein